MAKSNRPITSREYKLMLKPSEFDDKQRGIDKFLDLVKSQTEEQHIELKKDFNEKGEVNFLFQHHLKKTKSLN